MTPRNAPKPAVGAGSVTVRPALELDHVTRTFGSGRSTVRAVDDVSLSVTEGELVIVMGPSGSGKTTLLQLVGGLLVPTAGEIRIRDRSLRDLDRRELAALRLGQVGFIFQSFNLFGNLSAVENVALPAALAGVRRAERTARAAGLLDMVGMGPRAAHRPAELSGGEQQRVAVARALVNSPPLLLADEPTANLDSASGFQVLHLLSDIAAAEDKTVVMVTHDHRITPGADRLLWLEDGRLRDRDTSFATVADPVCGMEVVIDRAAAKRMVSDTSGRGTRTLYFCSAVCATKFDADPARWLGGPAPGTRRSRDHPASDRDRQGDSPARR
jgi:ABC-type lipoprotein export system ATPase subunit/YHS domain-containing protein